MTRPSTEDSRMTFEQLNTAHASALDTGEIPSPATPEGDAISIPRNLLSVWYDAAGELLQECDDWLKLKHGNHPSAAGLNFGETERRRELARLLFLDLAWLSGGSDLDAAPDRVASLPPQPADLRGEVEHWKENARLAQRFAEADKARAAKAEADKARAAKAEAERDDYKAAYEDTKRLAREIDVALHGEDGAAKQASLCDLVHPAAEMRARLAALTAQPVAQEPVAGAPETLRMHVKSRVVAVPGSAFDDRADLWQKYIRADLAHPATPAPVEAGLDAGQTLRVVTFLVEDGDTWALLPAGIRDDAMALFVWLALAQSAPVGGERISWRDDPEAIVEDDGPDPRTGVTW